MSDIQKRANLVLRELKCLFPKSETILNFSNHWELLVAVILSAQTSDEQVNKATNNLFKKYSTLIDYIKAKPAEFEKNISTINYYRTKSRHILATARLLNKKYHEILPKTIDEMLKFPGVGRKTALVVLGNAYNIIEGIAVDTHVKRLSRLFQLSKHTDPKKIEIDLQKIFPKNEWFGLTNRMISYGRVYCTARCKHQKCPIYQKLSHFS